MGFDNVVANVHYANTSWNTMAMVGFYNRLHKRRLLAKQLSKESKLVAMDSLKVLAEFEKLNDED